MRMAWRVGIVLWLWCCALQGVQAQVTTTGPASAATVELGAGWNLVGNTSTTPVAVQRLFADTSKTMSVWSWNNARGTWRFYSPRFTTPEALAAYAAQKGYEVLDILAPGAGFWIHALEPFALRTSVLAVHSLQTGEVSGYASITSDKPVLVFDPIARNPALVPGSTLRLGVSATDQRGEPMTVQGLQWTSSHSGVHVDASGNLRIDPDATGTAQVVVTDPLTGAQSSTTVTLLSLARPVDPGDANRNRIGMNTWFLNDWDGSYAFVDAMLHARPWQDAANWHLPVAGVDAWGWPTADASTVVYSGPPAKVNGTYKLVFEGQADVSPMWVPGSVTNKVYDPARNLTTADVTFNTTATGSAGLVLRNTRRTPDAATNTGFRNLRLFRPGYPADGSQVFTTPFVQALGQVGAVRLMDWSLSNGNLAQQWSHRRTPLHMSQRVPAYTGPGGGTWQASDPGVALEYQIQLCNTLKTDCWLNIPPLADDDYIHKMALALRFGTDGTLPYSSEQAQPLYPPLDPSLRIYLEVGNELWNSASGFNGFHVVKDLVGSLPTEHPLLTPAEPSIWYRMWRFPAYRVAQASDIFRAVYGDAAMQTRVRPLLMTQQGNGQATLSVALNWLDHYARRQTPARTPGYYVYGAGGSAYFGVNQEPTNITDLDGFFASGNYPSATHFKAMAIDAVWAANYGLQRVAYEGGTSLDNYSDVNASAINADPRMQDLMVQSHNAWSALGGDLLSYYTLVGPPKWEFTHDTESVATPKFAALLQLRGQNRSPVTLGQAFPGTLIAPDHQTYKIRSEYDYVTTCDGLPCIGGNRAGTWIAYPGNTAAPFTGTLSVNGRTTAETGITVWINGVAQGQVTLPNSKNLTDSSSLSVNLPAGLVVVRLQVDSGGLDLRSISIR